MIRHAYIFAVMLALLTGCQSLPRQETGSRPDPTPGQVQHAMSAYRRAHPTLCEICGKPATSQRVLEIHHVHPREAFPEQAAAPDNFILVCRNCHMWVCHPGDFGKYTDDLREWLKVRKIKENKP